MDLDKLMAAAQSAAAGAGGDGGLPAGVDLAALMKGVLGGGEGKKGAKGEGDIPGLEGVKTEDLMRQADVMWRHLDDLSSRDPAAYRRFLEKAAKDAGMEGKVPIPGGAAPAAERKPGPASDRVVPMDDGPGGAVPQGLRDRPAIVVVAPCRPRGAGAEARDAHVEFWADVKGDQGPPELGAKAAAVAAGVAKAKGGVSPGPHEALKKARGAALADVVLPCAQLREPQDKDVPAGGPAAPKTGVKVTARVFALRAHVDTLRVAGANNEVLRILIERAFQLMEAQHAVEFRRGGNLQVFRDQLVVPMEELAARRKAKGEEDVRQAAAAAGVSLPTSLASELAGMASQPRPGFAGGPAPSAGPFGGAAKAAGAGGARGAGPLIQEMAEGAAAPAAGASGARPEYEIRDEGNGELVMVVRLPGAPGMAGVGLDVGERRVVLDATQHGFARLEVGLPKLVDEGSARAKFSKAKGTLRVTMRVR
ncbi:unnamed protein product [Pedinophyceae sp. YPF-701]|nr:unnamed protein product [Pedinophyceae sp. YPF-701]